ncbi:DUF2196 domain-containing protein [Natrialbaceae archaeon GCM10025810]|uniref:DUF2196 domain-containing protein n=1 Tax=Halovalidus salilacus TaxID=3075124 RepID=UPI0036068BE6
MAANPDQPTADELRQGLTVRIVQEDTDVHSEDEEPIVGEVASIYEETTEGPLVELKSGVTGHVREFVVDE